MSIVVSANMTAQLPPPVSCSSIPSSPSAAASPSPSALKTSMPSSRSHPQLSSLSALASQPLTLANQRARHAASELCRYGNLSFQSHDYDSAIAHYTAALELTMDDPRTWNNRGTAYVAKKWYRMGIRDYNEAIERAPKCGEFFYKRGVAWSALKQYALAVEDYSKCLKLKPNYADALNNRGNAYRILRQFAAAKRDLESAVVLQPSSLLYQSNLARVLAAIEGEKRAETAINERLAAAQSLQQIPLAHAHSNSAPLSNADLTALVSSETASGNSTRASIAVIKALLGFAKTRADASDTSKPETTQSALNSLPQELIQTLLGLINESKTQPQQQRRRAKRFNADSDADSIDSNSDDSDGDVPHSETKKRVRLSVHPQSDSTTSLTSLTSTSSAEADLALSPHSVMSHDANHTLTPIEHETEDVSINQPSKANIQQQTIAA